MSDGPTTREILEGVRQAMAGLQTAGGAPLFELVSLYQSESLTAALGDLIVAGRGRLCLVVPGEETWASEVRGSVLLATRELSFATIIADRDYAAKPGSEAVFGDLGILVVKDQVVSALAGANVGLEGVTLIPEAGGAIEVRREDSDAPGRAGWILNWKTWGGRLKRSVGR